MSYESIGVVAEGIHNFKLSKVCGILNVVPGFITDYALKNIICNIIFGFLTRKLLFYLLLPHPPKSLLLFIIDLFVNQNQARGKRVLFKV